MTNLLHRNDEFLTVRNECSKIPLLTSTYYETRVRTWRAVRLSQSSRFFMRAAESKMRSSNSSPVYTFLWQTSLSIHPKNRNITESCLVIQTLYSELDTSSFELCFSPNYQYHPQRKYWHRPWITRTYTSVLKYRTLHLAHTLICFFMILTKTSISLHIVGTNPKDV